MYTIFIEHLEKSTTNNPIAYRYRDFSFWEKIIKWSISRASFYEVRLWEDDLKEINSIEMLGDLQINTETEEIVFAGKVNENIEYKLLSRYLTEDNHIKYFTVEFKNESDYIFSNLSHYGDEIILDVKDIEEARMVKKSLENEYLKVEILKSRINTDGYIEYEEL